MAYSLEQKNILIVPLSLFIRFNKKVAGGQLASLLGKSIDDLFSCDEEIQEYEKFCENLLHKILTSKIVADFNLGKKTTQEFISELLSFLKLPDEKSTNLETAWNSLIEFDEKSLEAFYALIELTHQGKSIYFIGDTNELHAKKVLDLFSRHRCENLSFKKNLAHSNEALPIAISQASESSLGNTDLAAQISSVFFCLSYVYKTLIEQPQDILTKLFTAFTLTPGLLTHLKDYLNAIGKTKEDILLINPDGKFNAITKKLAFDTISKDNFYTDLHKSADIAIAAIFASLPSESHFASTESIPLSAHP